MSMQELISAIGKAGVGIVATGAIVYLLIFITKKFVEGMVSQLERLVHDFGVFASKVRDEHNAIDTLLISAKEERKTAKEDLDRSRDRSAKQHDALMAQHHEMMLILGRINGYRGDH